MALTEKIELLGKGLYKGIPDELTLKAIPTACELDYVSGEDFDDTMLNKILPQAIEESINPKELFEIDYYWVCRCLRMLNYGPYYTINTIICPDCGERSNGEYQADFRTVACKALPENFKNDLVIDKDEFIFFDRPVHVKLLKIQEAINSTKDKAFKAPNGDSNATLARLCYSITAIGERNHLNPIETKMFIENNFSAADYQILKERTRELTDYGLRAGGSTVCPVCGSPNAAFLSLIDDRFFRPTLGDLREWKNSRSRGEN